MLCAGRKILFTDSVVTVFRICSQPCITVGIDVYYELHWLKKVLEYVMCCPFSGQQRALKCVVSLQDICLDIRTNLFK